MEHRGLDYALVVHTLCANALLVLHTSINDVKLILSGHRDVLKGLREEFEENVPGVVKGGLANIMGYANGVRKIHISA